ncbi:hypothetical protein D5272_03730 [bacterium D16-76]|nr:hypothetical protein [bacterium D16-76]
MKKTCKAFAAMALAAVLALCLGGCDIPMPGFADYDVSSYIQAYLDSSYHNANESIVALGHTTAQAAADNHATTVENAVVNFCNTYGLAFTEEQQAQLREVFSQVLQQAQYTVREEQKVDTGYYIEVEVTPITNFSDCSAQLQALRDQAQQEADAANEAQAEEGEDEDGGEDEDDSWEDEDEGPIATPAPTPVPLVDPRELYLEKALEFCRQQAASVRFGTACTMSLDIRQTSEGELQLDLNQIDSIDNTVLQFTPG